MKGQIKPEDVAASVKALKNLQEASVKALGMADSDKAKLSTIYTTLALSSGVEMLQGLLDQRDELRSAVTAALLSLESIPEAQHVSAVLQAAVGAGES